MVERLRGRAGQRQRQRRLRHTNGLCELCLAAGLTRLADVVDHIVPLARGGSDEDVNTRNLCDEHHREVTAEQFNQHVARAARGIARSGRPSSPDHPWNQPAKSTDPPGGSKVDRRPARTPFPPSMCCGSVFRVKSSGG